jgi:hypothetical protein
MSASVSNPERLLLALDQRLDHWVRLILYGRSAVWLGFENPPAAAATTQDVDSIIPAGEVQALADDTRFWDARDAVNQHFESEGLYITHLFPESEVFLRRDWLAHIVSVTKLKLHHLRLFRPATLDLVLTKMMRGNDSQDMADAGFMIRHDRITESQLLEAFSQMKPIEMAELREAFAKAKPVVLTMVRKAGA